MNLPDWISVSGSGRLSYCQLFSPFDMNLEWNKIHSNSLVSKAYDACRPEDWLISFSCIYVLPIAVPGASILQLSYKSLPRRTLNLTSIDPPPLFYRDSPGGPWGLNYPRKD